ncbi:amino acid adenylation domain-containing protein [Chitinophaga pendula]|uniref:non-ribosomal peptide synthetase n=1 Tax=Chitinophaga TaxID=79328 RepID=UPI0018DF1E00|nr:MULTISPECIES: non-ribosomal peptide synthetase [Chitinophaga]UCJ04803.1 amino acid adenylation domain-containing protein [Chitinophaga pendula]
MSVAINEVIRIINNAKKQDIILFLEEGKLKVKVAKNKTIDPALMQEIKQYSNDIRLFLHNNTISNDPLHQKLMALKRDPHSRIPLSFNQERLWFIDRLEGSQAYHIPIVLRLRGRVNLAALESSLQQIIQRHEVLRTVIHEEEGSAYQHIQSGEDWQLEVIKDPILQEETSLSAYIDALTAKAFDLSTDYMLRGSLLELSPIDHILVLTLHHIASDGWSMPVIVRELVILYGHYGQQQSLPALPLQYADYSLWQRTHAAAVVSESSLSYWQQQLRDITPLELPTDHARPAIVSVAGASYVHTLDITLQQGLQQLSQSNGATMFMTLLAGFQVLLHRYSGQSDISVGSPIANRPYHELEGLVGFFVNTLVLRSDLSGNPTFRRLLEQVRGRTLEAYEHQSVPFEKVVESVVKERDMSRRPLFQVLFVLQNMGQSSIGGEVLGDVEISWAGYTHRTSKFDLTFMLEERPTGLHLQVEYSTELYEQETIVRMVGHYEQLLRSALADIDKEIGCLPMLLAGEMSTLQHFNSGEVNYPKDKTILDLFREQVLRTPDATALVYEGTTLSYRELDERSNQLGYYLRHQGIREDSLVPICVDRSLEMIIGIMGILKAGGAYVPMDPAYPAERLDYILKDTGAEWVVSSRDCHHMLPVLSGVNILLLDDAEATIWRSPAGQVENTVYPHHLAYVIYTSGSTGMPKGVFIEHSNVVRLFKTDKPLFDFNSSDVWTLFHSFCFDFSVWEIYGALFNGGRLVIVPQHIARDTDAFAHLLNEQGVTVLNQTPSAFYVLQDHVTTNVKYPLLVRYVIFGGEALDPARLKPWKKLYRTCRLINMYGITETTVHVTFQELGWSHLESHSSIIGQPIPTLSVHILDPWQQLVPLGVPGELYIGGAGVARGYLNRPELTAERFVSNPHGDGRLYRTGDLGRWLPDGNIEYIGRIDDQVKIRGYRIELGEIESALYQSGLVHQGVVVARSTTHGHQQLVGYVIPEGSFDREGIHSYLRSKLPDYMVPGILVEMSIFPLTLNGKIDRKSLPSPQEDIAERAYEAPRTATEQLLAGIWEELLGVPRVGIHDNFFELGGDSIITIQVVSRARRHGCMIQPRDIFQHQTLSRLSAMLSTQEGLSGILGEQGYLSGVSGMLPIQQWYFEHAGPVVSHFNQSVLLGVPKTLSVGLLDAAVRELLSHHDALRFVYTHGATGWEQHYGSYEGCLIVEALGEVAAPELGTLIRTRGDHYQRSLDITKGELVRVVLLETPSYESYNRLLIVIHHLSVDGVSWRILLEDLEELLGGVGSLGDKGSSYREWYDRLAHYSKEPALLSQADHWTGVTQRYQPLPVDRTYNDMVSRREIGHHVVHLEAAYTQQLLQEVPRVYQTEVNDLLLASLAWTLCAWSGREEVTIGLEGHGREQLGEGIDLSRTVGWFTNLYPVLLAIPLQNAEDVIKGVKEQLRQIPGKGLGYGVLKYIHRLPGLSGSAPWDVVFNYLGQLDNVLNNQGLFAAVPEQTGENSSQYHVQTEKLVINGWIQGGQLHLDWRYSARHYEHNTVEKLSQSFIKYLSTLITDCISREKHQVFYTPSDFGLGKELSYTELDRFLDEPDIAGVPRRKSLTSMYRLSGLQQGMLFHGLYGNRGGAYIEQVSCDLSGLDQELLSKSWSVVLQRHSILRSGFYYDVFNIPVQCVYQTANLPLTIHDFRSMDVVSQGLAVSAFERADQEQGFDFKAVPLMRVNLLRLSDTRYRMIWTAHHILFDGWSMQILMEAFLECYEQLAAGQQPDITVEDRFEDYIRYIEKKDKQQEADHWKRYLSGVSSGSLLPFVRPGIERTKGAGSYGKKRLVLDAAFTALLAKYARQHHITINTVMQGVWSYLLHYYTGQKDIVFGVTVSGRPEDMEGVEKRVGMYINALPLHAVYDPEQHITAWLQDIQTGQISAREYQYSALNDIQNWTGLGGDLFDSLLIFENYPLSEVVANRQWQLEVANVQVQEQTNYPLSIIIMSAAETVISFSYNASILDDIYVDAIAGHFEYLLRQLPDNPGAKLKDLVLLTPVEWEYLQGFNATTVPYPSDKTILDLFAEQVSKMPDASALIFEGVAMSYNELDIRSNQLAHYLRKQGVREEQLVPVCIERRLELVIGILGILKAGAAYVPVDPTYPRDRLVYMLEDTGANLVLCSSDSRSAIPSISGITMIALDERTEIFRQEPEHDVTNELQSSNLAYVIYTSGSTGKPKGVMIEHHNLVNFSGGMCKALPLTSGDHLLAITSVSFDISILEILWTICNGIKVTLRGNSRQLDTFDQYLPGKGAATMDFSLFYFSSVDDADRQGKYDFLLQSAKFGDDHDFAGIWIPERHFHEFGGLFPNPAVVAAGIATVTKKIDIRSGSLVLPLHDVVRAAEEWAVVDNLSNGRVSLAIASGWHADDFILMPANYKERHVNMYRQIEELRELWKGGSIQRINGLDKEIDVKIFPRPTRPAVPLWITSSGNPETFRSAGKIGADILTHLLGQKTEDLERNIRLYKQTLQEYGHPVEKARIALMLHTYIGADYDTVKAESREPFKAYLRSNLSLLKNLAQSADIHFDDIDESTLQDLLDLVFERYWNTSALLGTKESCSTLIETLAAIGVTEIACLMDFGIATEKVLNSLHHLNELRQLFVKTDKKEDITGVPVTALQITPSYLKALLEDRQSYRFLRALKHLIIGGENLPDELIEQLLQKTSATITNVYGPTETTIWSTTKRITTVDKVNIGKPIDNTVVYLLDREGRPVPLGVPGELYIGGAGVARGYLNRPELTAERFVSNPYGDGRLYRTGDLGRWLPDGNIEYIGRIDDQVKIRGYRIELGEIESALYQSGLVHQGVVVARSTTHGHQQLVGYVIPEGSFDREGIHSYLRSKLPDYMVPGILVEMSIFPLTLNGKIDRKSLPSPQEDIAERAYEAPRTATEQLLAGIWEELLGVPRVGIHDNFFELGGDSIITIQVVSRARRHGCMIQPRDIFQHQTLSRLSAMLSTQEGLSGILGEQGYLSGVSGMLPIQQWYFEHAGPVVSHFNQSVLLGVPKTLSVGLLDAAVRELLSHHDALRFVYTHGATGWEQHYGSYEGCLIVEALGEVAAPELGTLIRTRGDHYQRSLDIMKGELVRVVLLETPSYESYNRLLIVIHHLSVDGVSWRILLEDLEELLGGVGSLGDKGSSYREWYDRLAHYSKEPALLSQADYWTGVTQRYQPLPVDQEYAFPVLRRDMQLISVVLEETFTQQLLQEVPRVYQTEINDLLLTALAWTLCAWSGREEVTIGLEGHGREQLSDDIDLSRTVGWFATLYPVLLAAPEGEISEMIKNIKEQLRQTPGKGLGYGVLKYLHQLPALSGTAPWDIVFNYIGQLDNVFNEDSIFTRATESSGDRLTEEHIISDKITINIIVQRGTLIFDWTFSSRHYNNKTIRQLATAYLANLRLVIQHCLLAKQ